VVVRQGAPLSYANAFTKPVASREADGDVMAASIARLARHRDVVESAYSRDKDATHRFVLSLREGEVSASEDAVKTMDELVKRLAAALAALPVDVGPKARP